MKKVLYIMGQLTDDDIEWMTRAGTQRRLADGDQLIRQGEGISSIYILLNGYLQVSAQGLGLLATLGVGEIVGEMSFVDSAPPSATVTASGDCLVFQLSKDDLQRKLNQDPSFGQRFYRALAIFLADRLRSTVKHLGYGAEEETSLDADEILEDELDENLLDTVSVAGERFDRMLKALVSGKTTNR
uniref:cAMP-binding proteins - catabolite gene activator and regulatory subunit of cAMP-dependent protein kinases n=1 Tax=uncultured Thiotrichaceae bacterium TaxID=298394 RepID=A0A6S6UDX9_9GAMM|nr:MAG: cAMP-binding proteins - catabolite gene activator and regulatory subunit of cAMP-dependent protein kinases [uncultured Thiotrichaceae bacterium]